MNTVGAAITVALLGNPNTGKSTLFSALVGVSQRVGNYPGVTVEKKVGHTQYAGRQLTVIDLPGTYSLAPHSLDEMVAVDVLLGRRSDVPPPTSSCVSWMRATSSGICIWLVRLWNWDAPC